MHIKLLDKESVATFSFPVICTAGNQKLYVEARKTNKQMRCIMCRSLLYVALITSTIYCHVVNHKLSHLPHPLMTICCSCQCQMPGASPLQQLIMGITCQTALDGTIWDPGKPHIFMCQGQQYTQASVSLVPTANIPYSTLPQRDTTTLYLLQLVDLVLFSDFGAGSSNSDSSIGMFGFLNINNRMFSVSLLIVSSQQPELNHLGSDVLFGCHQYTRLIELHLLLLKTFLVLI